jgi:ABC-type transport system substrate-binding protein
LRREGALVAFTLGIVQGRRDLVSSHPMQQATVEVGGRTPVGTVNVVDPHPLNWLYITWNTMEEPVRTDERGHMVGAVMEEAHWTDEKTLEIIVRRSIRFQDGEECNAHSIKRAFEEMQRWKAPHPPGSNLNIHPETVAEIVDDYKLRINFPEPDGLVLGKMRGMHIPSTRFWEDIGFGYKKLGTGEGHW